MGDLKNQTSLFSFFTGNESSEIKIKNLDRTMTENKTSNCSNTGSLQNVSSKVTWNFLVKRTIAIGFRFPRGLCVG
jgi:hypothetical protein